MVRPEGDTIPVNVYDKDSTCRWDVVLSSIDSLLSIIVFRYRRVTITLYGDGAVTVVVSGRRGALTTGPDKCHHGLKA
jgi:hypothetical protein